VSRSDQLRLHEEESRRCTSATPPYPAQAFVSSPRDLLPHAGTPDTIAGWKTLADSFLTDQACAFHRNVEISSRYAWMYRLLPRCLKWAGMAAIASHHVRLALFPLRLDTDRTGYVNLRRSLGRQKWLLMEDVNTIRETNNGIYDDIFWAHLAYVSGEDGIGRLRGLLQGDAHRVPVLAGFEAIDRGRRLLEDAATSAEDRRAAAELIWAGNVQLLQHEQRALVQPHFDRLSCAFARLCSLGAATSFEAHGVRRETAFFTSFYGYSLTSGMPHVVQARAWPRITLLDDRWRWLVASVVPHFRKFDADVISVDAGLQRIFDEAVAYASVPCVLPRPLQLRQPRRR
jgi:hypothetical protein